MQVVLTRKASLMTTKTSIIDALGEGTLLLPQKIVEALAANERLKLCFTVLQAAERHAERPDEPLADLSAELRAAGLDGDLGLAVANSRSEADGGLSIGGASRIREIVLEGIATMLEPLSLAAAPQAEELAARERAFADTLPPFTGDRVPKGVISAMTRVSRSGSKRGESLAGRSGASVDSLHGLVMDIHRALNALQASVAEETIDGARAWHIEDADRAVIRAFMSGLNDTAALKFNHPGLGTTATRAGARLVIENDIGTTDAHVLVLRIEGEAAMLTYTDVHGQRLEFFQSLLKPFSVQWSDSQLRRDARLVEDAEFYQTVGRFEAKDAQSLEHYLAYLGSRVVFLIDWNRARKQLREFLPQADAVRLLKWAADSKLGHRGFLELGGAQLINEAIEFAQRTPLRYGERLDEALGAETTFDYLQFVLREAASGLLQGRSERFIRDEIKAELARRLRTAHASLLGVALAHAERVFDLATDVSDGLEKYAEGQGSEPLEHTARRARKWEQECDAIVSRVRSLAQRTSKPEAYAAWMHQADEAADGLEEAAFLMTHLAAVAPAAQLMQPVRSLASLVLEGAQESVKMYEAARHVTREGAREDFQDFFAAADRVVAVEHATDTAERVATTALLGSGIEARALHLLSRIVRALEATATHCHIRRSCSAIGCSARSWPDESVREHNGSTPILRLTRRGPRAGRESGHDGIEGVRPGAACATGIAGSSGLCAGHCGLQGLFRGRRPPARRPEGAGRSGARASRRCHRNAVRRRTTAAARLRALRRARVHAGHVGDPPQRRAHRA